MLKRSDDLAHIDLSGDADCLVKLDRDHPGFRDPVYRERRDTIARYALEHQEGESAPLIEYTPAEHGVWAAVWENLAPLHDRYACTEWLDGSRRLELDRSRIPQLREVNERLALSTGFRLEPVAGLVTPARFLQRLGREIFLATQYMRHPSEPLYTPEPDVVHELIGHAVSLAQPDFARLNRRFGEVALEASDEACLRLTRVYWYTLEFGVLEVGSKLSVYGAGLLSSFGELGRFETTAKLSEFDLDAMAETPFDPTDYQRELFVAPPFPTMARALEEWLFAQR